MTNKSLGAAACGIMLASCFLTLAKAGEDPLVLDMGEGATMEMVRIKPGRFLQGSPDGEPGRAGDETPREVTLSRGFFIAKTPVTLAQWRKFVAETGFRSEAEIGTSGGFGWNGTALAQDKRFTWRNPGFPQTPDDPACIITFEDARAFCSWLARKTGRVVSLPTEAQWEYACRAETTSAWHSGASADASQGGYWHKANSGNSTHPVSTMALNPWGIHIGGNVAEWCLDWYAPYLAEARVDPLQDNPALSDKPRRVLRGGSWMRDVKNTRSASRWRSDPGSRNADIGFRVLCSLEKNGAERAAAPGSTPLVLEKPDPPSPASQAAPSAPRPADTGTRDPSPPTPVTGFGGLLGSLLCLVIPLGVVFWVFRLIAGHGKSSANPFVIPETTPPPLPGMDPGILKTDDGFWLNGNWPAGTRLMLHYVVDGVPHDQSMIYQPGPNGQFIYTGRPPQSVGTVTDEGSESSALPPPMPESSWDRENRGDGVARESRLFDENREAGRSSARPPVFPSAY